MSGVPRLSPDALRGKKVTLVGLGTFGGGTGAARFFLEAGADLLITDLRTEQELASSLKVLDGHSIRYRLGGHEEEDVREADLVVFSPAVPPHSPLLRAARAAGKVLTSPLNLAWERLPIRPVGVTGSRGKTTTTTLLHSMLKSAGRDALLGGNVGGSLLDDLHRVGPETVVVLELSSFQLHWLRELGQSPRVSVVTNLTPHHLDWHGDLGAYARAKQTVLEFQGAGDTAVLDGDDEVLRGWGEKSRGDVFRFSTGGDPGADASLAGGMIRLRTGGNDEPLCSLAEIPMRGAFQAKNVMAAALAARSLGVDNESIRKAVLEFPGLPHRIERVAVQAGVEFYNDSKATTPTAAAAAIESFDGPVLWIGGGKDTGEAMGPLVQAAAGRVRKAYLVGEAASRMARDLAEAIPLSAVCESLEEAVRLAREDAVEGSAVLLSPGCSSYDQFLNYEERGNLFRSLVLGS